MALSSSWRRLALCLGSLLAFGCARPIAMRGDGWWSIRTAHVHLETDAGRDRGIREAARLEDMHRALSSTFYHCTEHDQDVAEVVILGNEDEFLDLAGQVSGTSLSGSDGMLAQPRRIVTLAAELDAPGGRQVATHELTHGMVAACFPNAPTWLNEGLAGVFETILLPEPEVAVIGYPSRRTTEMPLFLTRVEHQQFDVRYTPRAALPSVYDVIHGPSSTFYHAPTGGMITSSAAGVAANYTAATLVVYMLAIGPSPALRARFVSYLESLRRGVDPGFAFAMAFEDVDLQRELDGFLDGHPFDVHERILPRADVSPPAVHAIGPAEAHLRLAELEVQSRARAGTPNARTHLALVDRDPSWRPQSALLRADLDPIGADRQVAIATTLAPNDLDVMRARAILALRDGDHALVATLARRLEGRVDLRPSDLVVLADLERDAGDLAGAEARAHALLRTDRSRWGAWAVLARVALERGDTTRARELVGVLRVMTARSAEARATVRDLDARLAP